MAHTLTQHPHTGDGAQPPDRQFVLKTNEVVTDWDGTVGPEGSVPFPLLTVERNPSEFPVPEMNCTMLR